MAKRPKWDKPYKFVDRRKGTVHSEFGEEGVILGNHIAQEIAGDQFLLRDLAQYIADGRLARTRRGRLRSGKGTIKKR